MSTGMNQWLAQIYGTDGAEDIEKTAQAHLLQKLAAEQNLDISQFTPEELEQLVQELAAEGYDVGALAQPQMQQQPQMGLPNTQVPGQPGMNPMMGQRPQSFAPAQQPQQPQTPGGMSPQMMQQPQQSSSEVMQKEAQAKFEEADLLGRVMAHAYTDELEKIATHRKTAGRFSAAKDAVKGAVGSARNRAGNAAERFGAKAHSKTTEYGMKARHHKGAIAAGAGGATAGFIAGRKSKEASAFEKLAEEHAAEILSSTGYDPSTGQDMYGQQMLQNAMPQMQPQTQPQSPNTQQEMMPQMQQSGVEQPPVDPTAQYSDALDQRALELLAENGYDVNEILARIQMAQTPAQA